VAETALFLVAVFEMNSLKYSTLSASKNPGQGHLRGRRVAVVVFSHYPSDPRPRREAEALVNLGMEVDVISIKQNNDEPRQETFNGVDILRVPIKRRRGGKFVYVFQYASFILISFFLLAFRSVTRRYSLVHVHNMPDVLVFAALIPKLCGAKVILDLHDPMPELMMTIFGLKQGSFGVRLLKRLEKWSIGFANAVLAVNVACRKIFSERSCRAGKVHVVMNSPDEGIFKYREAGRRVSSGRDAAKPFIIMYHGSLVERHGLDLAVTALKKIKRSIPKAELRVYGQSTPFLEQVMNSVQEPDLRNAIHCFGSKKLEEIAEAIGECDLGIIPNRRSIFTELNTPTRIFEYLSQGKPVIAPSVHGIQDYFGPGDLIFFRLGDADDLAEKIEYVFLHPEEIRGVVRRGQEIYSDHKWDCERTRLVNLVEDLLATKNRLKPATPEERGFRALEITHDRPRSSLD
jgi:glycosyltransferase involved in cell wall biosynthesis